MYKLFRVRGRSMLPTLADGDFVIGRRISAGAVQKLTSDHVVCVQHPGLGALIKRIKTIGPDAVSLSSDGQTGSESEHLGPVSPQHVTHRARFIISARGGVRRL